MSIRDELILKALAGEDTKVELAKEYGISRKTLYNGLTGTRNAGWPDSSTSRAVRAARRL